MLPDMDRLWRAIEAGDTRFDGWVFVGVRTTGIYCRPSCPARTPKRENARLYPSAASAQAAGYRACKRCRPDAAPGSPEWDQRADVVGRAMRLIADGVVDREGVRGLAARLGYGERHVHRQLVAVLGAGPLAIARSRRAQTARTLLETTSVPVIEVALAAGFGSLRQFNETIQAVFASTPTALRERAGRDGREAGGGAIRLRLPFRVPLDGPALLAFLAARAVPGVEAVEGGAYRRSLRLPHGPGVVELEPLADCVEAGFRLADLRDLGSAIQRVRRLLDLDSDPATVLEALGRSPVMAALVRAAPGVRAPRTVDGSETAFRAVLGQQVTLRAARTLAGRLAAAYGEPLARPLGGVTLMFPSAAALAQADLEAVGMPLARRRALGALACALADGLSVDAGADRPEVRRRLARIPGIGPWTIAYVEMRALGDPDAFLESDLGVRAALARLGRDTAPRAVRALAEQWRPYRAYAVHHLWSSLARRDPAPAADGDRRPSARRPRRRSRPVAPVAGTFASPASGARRGDEFGAPRSS